MVAVGDEEVCSPVEAPALEDLDDLTVHRRLRAVGVLRRVDVDRGAVRVIRRRRRRAARDRPGRPAAGVHLDLRAEARRDDLVERAADHRDQLPMAGDRAEQRHVGRHDVPVDPRGIDRQVGGVRLWRGGELSEVLLEQDRGEHAAGDPHVARAAGDVDPERILPHIRKYEPLPRRARELSTRRRQEIALVGDPEPAADLSVEEHLRPADGVVWDDRADADRPRAERELSSSAEATEPRAVLAEHGLSGTERRTTSSRTLASTNGA